MGKYCNFSGFTKMLVYSIFRVCRQFLEGEKQGKDHSLSKSL